MSDFADAPADDRPRHSRRQRRRHHRSHSDRDSQAQRSRPVDPIRAWLGVIDGLLQGLEETIWQVREIAERTVAAVDDTRDSLDGLRSQGRDLERQASRLPQKVARLSTTAWVLTQITAACSCSTSHASTSRAT